MSSGCTENPVTLWKLAAAAPCGVLIPALLSLWIQTDSVLLWGAESVVGGQRVSHIERHTHIQKQTHWVPLMTIIRAFRGCPWRQAGDWGVIFTLKRPMIGSDCDNDHHYCHYSMKWLTERRRILKRCTGFVLFLLWLGYIFERKLKWYMQDGGCFYVPYMKHNSKKSKNTIFLKLVPMRGCRMRHFIFLVVLSFVVTVHSWGSAVKINPILWVSPHQEQLHKKNVLFSFSSSFCF